MGGCSWHWGWREIPCGCVTGMCVGSMGGRGGARCDPIGLLFECDLTPHPPEGGGAGKGFEVKSLQGCATVSQTQFRHSDEGRDGGGGGGGEGKRTQLRAGDGADERL